MKHKLSVKIAGMPLVYLTIFLSSFNWINGANIIAFLPLNLKSSAIFSETVVKTLVEAGHDVTYVTSIPFNEPLTNCTVIDFESDDRNQDVPLQPTSVWDLGWIGYARQAFSTQRERLCFSKGVKKSMDELKTLGKKFDLLIIHLSFYPKCFLPIAQEFGIPYIGISALRTFWYTDLLMGNPRNIASTPVDFGSFYTQRTFWNRLVNTLEKIALMYILQEFDSVLQDSRFKRHFPNFEIDRVPKMSLVFNNNHGSILPRPLCPNTIDIGGIHISQAAAALPQHLKTFLDEGERGVILFSLGSRVQGDVFDSEKRRILLNVFARLPERVIWKFSEKLSNLPPNVLITKWLPQRDVLAHKNVKVFITHCGFFGTQEAIYEGKPLVMMPLNVDQPGNAALMYQRGVGEYIDLDSLEEEKLFNIIRQVIDNKKYRDNMEQLSLAYKDRPMTPKESVIYWTKYVLRHKEATHLHSMAADMPFYQYFLLDVILLLIIICISLVWVSYFILKQVIRHFFKKSRWLEKTDSKKLD